jgi:benzoyl-CoA reductase/2-hydroxyglutaryl-CoA dehydratase subunit BcrC/BadD/HgdB
MSLRSANPAPISGLDALLANQVFFYDNPKWFTESVNMICDELEKRVEEKMGVFQTNTPRISSPVVRRPCPTGSSPPH